MPLVSQCCRGKKASPEEDEDDDVLPGTPEDEQPANAGHGHSIINMGGMDFDR
jgi:hypothetical protein